MLGSYYYSTLKVGTCRQCTNKAAWGSGKSAEFCPHQRQMLKHAIETGSLVSKKIKRKTRRLSPVRLLPAGRRKNKIKPMATYDDNFFAKKKLAKRRKLMSHSLPKLKGAYKLRKPPKWTGGVFKPMEVDEEALIEHAFHLSDSYGLGFIHRSEFLTTLLFNEEISIAISGSQVLRRLAHEEALQAKFMRFRTKHMQNMTLAELFKFLGVKSSAQLLAVDMDSSALSAAHELRTPPESLVSTAFHSDRKKNIGADTPPLRADYTFSKRGLCDGKLIDLSQKILSLKKKLIGMLRYQISANKTDQHFNSIRQASDAYRTALDFVSKLKDTYRGTGNDGTQFAVRENLLTAAAPVVSGAAIRIDSVNSLLHLNEMYKGLMKRFHRIEFLDYDEAQQIRIVSDVVADKINYALGTGSYGQHELPIMALKQARKEAQSAFQQLTRDLDHRQWALERRNWPNNYRARVAATLFQNEWRCFIARRVMRIKRQYQIATKHARFKCMYSPFLLWRIYVEELIRKRIHAEASINIQRVRRGKRDRDRIKQLRSLRHSSAMTIQRFIRSKRLFTYLRQYNRRKRAAVKIQSVSRMWETKAMFQKKVERVRRANFYREHIANQKVKEWLRSKEIENAARKLQRSFLLFKQRKRAWRFVLEMENRRRNRAAMVVQTSFRGYRSRIRIVRVQKAAKLVQRWHRAKQDRWEFLLHYQRKKKGTQLVQKLWRGKLGRKIRDNVKIKLARERAVRIEERRLHAERARQEAEHKKLELAKQAALVAKTRHDSARHIQRHARGRIDRKKVAARRQKSLSRKREQQRAQAALKIQCLSRKSAARSEVSERRKILHVQQRAAKSIQSVVRGSQGRKKAARQQQYLALRRNREYQMRLEKLQLDAATRIQKTVRGHQSRENMRRIRRKQAMLAVEQEELATLKRTSASIMIQRHVRGKASREKVAQLRDVRQKAHKGSALVIQRHWRGHRGRLTANVAQTEKGRALKKRHESALAIQRHWRGKSGRLKAHAAHTDKLQAYAQRQEHSAMDIQRVVRGHLGRLLATNQSLENQRRARLAREAAIKKAAVKRKEQAMEAMERNSMLDEERHSVAHDKHLRLMAEAALRDRNARQEARNRKEIEEKEKQIRIERLDGLKEALRKAEDTEAIRAISFLIPDNEGIEFSNLKIEAMKKLTLMEERDQNAPSSAVSMRVDEGDNEAVNDDWVEAYDEESGMAYYICTSTGETSWEKPDSSTGILDVSEHTPAAPIGIFERVAKRAAEAN